MATIKLNWSNLVIYVLLSPATHQNWTSNRIVLLLWRRKNAGSENQMYFNNLCEHSFTKPITKMANWSVQFDRGHATLIIIIFFTFILCTYEVCIYGMYVHVDWFDINVKIFDFPICLFLFFYFVLILVFFLILLICYHSQMSKLFLLCFIFVFNLCLFNANLLVIWQIERILRYAIRCCLRLFVEFLHWLSAVITAMLHYQLAISQCSWICCWFIGTIATARRIGTIGGFCGCHIFRSWCWLSSRCGRRRRWWIDGRR